MSLHLQAQPKKIALLIQQNFRIGICTASLVFAGPVFAESISYAQAEQSILKDSYSTQASQALQLTTAQRAVLCRVEGLNLVVRQHGDLPRSQAAHLGGGE